MINEFSNGVKLTNTVYKILEFFPEADPLKNRAKDRALLIMEHLILIKKEHTECPGWVSFQEEKVKSQLIEDIDILLGYLWVAKSQGWLNSSNFLIISNEYEKIKKDIKPIIEPTMKLPGIDVLEVKENLLAEDQSQQEHILNKEESKEQNNYNNLINISERQKKIIEFLNNNKRAQVMDLQTVLPDVTKRTIRRDLDELLNSGKIIRMGDFNQVFYKINN